MATFYQVIPRRLTSSSLSFWLGIWREDFPGGVRFRLSRQGSTVPIYDTNLSENGWQKRGAPPKRRVWHRWLEVNGLQLQPRTNYLAELRVNNSVRATAIVRTLPNRIPSREDVNAGLDRHFTVFVGSCYYRINDPNLMVPDSYMKLWNDSLWQPDLKLLCGDQIYFDNPWLEFSAAPPFDYGREWIRERLTRKYRNTWEALSPLLSHGATYMLTDDHEFWNDYPYFAGGAWIFGNPSLEGIGDYIKSKTEQFADAFQLQRLADVVKIGEDLEFFLLDTRRNRSSPYASLMPTSPFDLMTQVLASLEGASVNESDYRFATQGDFSSAISWLKNLKSPGVLVMSSPIFVERIEELPVVGVYVTEHKLPFFDYQFRLLAHALLESRVDVVIVAGDPHFSRIAVARVDSPHPHKIVEVISSALATVDGSPGDPKPGPRHFPTPRHAHLQIPSVPVEYREQDFSRMYEGADLTMLGNEDRAVDNFVTLSFAREPKGGIEMLIRSWMCKRRDNSQVQVPVDFERRITLYGEQRPVTEDIDWLVPVLTAIS